MGIALAPHKEGTVIAELDATAAAGVAVDFAGGGRVVGWGDEWIEYDPIDARLWQNLMAWLGQR